MSSSVSLEYLQQQISGLTVTSPTTTALCAQNNAGATIVVILLGTAVPLPTRPYNSGFAANGANTQFTVQTAGTYYIEYDIETTVSLLLSSSVYRNGTSIPNLVRSPGITGTSYRCSAIVPLNAADVLQLTLYGLAGTAVLQGGNGATLNVVRVA